MRIAQISTLSSPVRRHAGGSVESFIWLLTRELARLGHEVTVFGAAGAQVDGKTAGTLPGPYGAPGSPDDWQLCEWINLCKALERSGEFDLLHTHAYLWGLPLQPLSKAPMAHTLHIVPDDNHAHLWKMHPNSCVTALSKHQWSAYPQLRPAAIIPHGVDFADFTFRAKPEDYVCYLGRFVSGKGPLHAIDAARASGIRLLLAGPSSPYFREKVQPLVDGKRVEYVGPVTGAERDQLLGGARALLYPIQYAEAFGLVLVEAMLCGTPVAAMRLGAVPEIIDEGTTGYSVEALSGFKDAVVRCFSLDRARVRKQAASRFSPEHMAGEYVRVYERLLSEGASL